MTGIYKITSPSGKVYIGQSLNINRRWAYHRSEKSNSCKHLKSSFLKYGIDSHNFEVIHDLPFDASKEVMDEYERLYIDLYKQCGIKLLNIKDGGSFGRHSEETKMLFSKQRKGVIGRTRGRKLTEEHKSKLSIAHKGKKLNLCQKQAAIKNLNRSVGSNNHQSKLSANDARLIKNQLKIGNTIYRLSKIFKVGKACIFDIKHGITWKHLQDQ